MPPFRHGSERVRWSQVQWPSLPEDGAHLLHIDLRVWLAVDEHVFFAGDRSASCGQARRLGEVGTNCRNLSNLCLGNVGIQYDGVTIGWVKKRR